MGCRHALAIGLIAASGICAAAEPGTLARTCSIEEVGKKLEAYKGNPKKVDLRMIKQQCNWAVDASSCTFNYVIQMYLENKTSAEVRSQCMR